MPLMLIDGARTWIEGLPPKTINSWEDMARVFTQHFRGTYKRPKNVNDLYLCTQYDNEGNIDFIS